MANLTTYGALKTLYQTLVSSSTLTGFANVLYGEESKALLDSPPVVVMVPTSGSYRKDEVGYQGKGADPGTDMAWPLQATVEFWCWAAAADTAQPVDNADATENLRAYVLQSLWDQRGAGLYFEPVGERWESIGAGQGGGVNIFGRALVLTTLIDITVGYYPPVNATVADVTLDPITLGAP